MGIPHFFQMLDAGLIPCNIAEIRVAGRARVRAGVDASCYLMKGISSIPGPVDYVIQIGKFIRSKGLDVVFVLDGLPYGPKRVAYAKRQKSAKPFYDKRCKESVDQLIQKFKKTGFEYTTSVYEADAQLAKLAADGHIDLVVTEDSDLVVYGCPLVFYKLDVATGNGMLYDLETLEFLFGSGYNVDILRRVCLAIGSDYTPGITGFGIEAAKKMYGHLSPLDSVEDFILKVWEYFPNLDVHGEFEKETEDGELAFKYHPVFEVTTGRIVPLIDFPSPEEAVKARLVTGAGIGSQFRYNIKTDAARADALHHSLAVGAIFQCPRCPLSFETQHDYRVHYTTHRKCPDCGRKFGFPYLMDIHRACHSSDRKFPCPVCEKTFKTYSNLWVHRVAHEPTRRYICSICRMGFTNSSNLNAHRVVHTGERNFICATCGKAFKTRGHLQTHKRIHTGEKPFICEICNRSFRVKSMLTQHRNVHSDKEYDHSCSTCGKKLSSKSTLQRHEKTHSTARPYICECGKELQCSQDSPKTWQRLQASQKYCPTLTYASDAFSDVEDLLGLNFDWLLLRKSKDPQWKYRPLPTSTSFVLCLQYRFGHCSLGEKCPDAHGEGELEEWKRRYEIENVSRKISNLKVDDGSTYIKDLLTIVQSGNNSILSENDSEQIRISCVSPLHTTVQQRKFKKFTWKFTVKTSKPLTYVCLLHDHHRQYFHISSCSFVGPNDSIILNQSGKSEANSQVITPQLSEAALAIAGGNVSSYTYKVKVVFTPEVYGNFRQTTVFDIGDKIKTIRNVSVDVVPPPESDRDLDKCGNENSSSPVDRGKGFRNNVPWNFGNADMVDGNTGEKMPSERLGFALIGSSFSSKADTFMENAKDPLSKEHYKERMRFLLTQEERSRQEILAKYNVTTNVYLSEKYIVTGGYNEGMARYAVDGTLYGKISLFRDISEDTAVGRLILRSCNAVLLTKSEESRRSDFNSKIRVYFCPISDKTKNSVYLDLGRTCVSELGLKDGDVMQFDIQFQLDRTAFIEQKKVIDQLAGKHLDMLFPDLAINCNIPWSPIKQWSEIETSGYRLNPKQKEALIAITAENCRTPPILVIGPFGSGKTFTLAQCIRKILTQKNTRVMVCTHSNSAADLYIKEYLDSWVKEGFLEARPLRIYYEMRNLSSVHQVVLQYCTIEAMKFRPPTYQEVLNHRVIVVTLSTSYLLMEMNLPEDTFSHILLDEAAQAMESEAITPLMSAGRNTKLVLAGDHFQLSPELFSEEARNIHPSLLERLHALYPDSHPCKLMLCENYRSHSAIIQFVSESFYTKKLECAKSQPVHDNFFPITFFAARGEDVQDSESTSYYNMAEVFELTEKISELISSWPEKWGDYRDENAIGVLTPYADQVSRIRNRLRKKGLHSVSVERVFNVQGKQFRAVFLSTVRTFRPWVRILPEAVGNEVDLGFFSSPKLLNTALTRAQSLVAVVGDPVSLCSVGKCRRIWEDYIRICHESKSLFGITFLQLKQSILGVEMRLTWGLNPLANEFQPQQHFNRLPTTLSAVATVHAPATISNVHPTTVHPPLPNQASYMYNKARPRAPVYVDPHAGYYAPPQNFPDNAHMLPQSGGHVHNNPLVYPGSQQSVYMRPPVPGGVGVVPGYTPYAAPPLVPWNQNIPVTPTPAVQVPNMAQSMQTPHPVVPGPAQVNVRAAVQTRAPHYPSSTVVHPSGYPTHMVHGGNSHQPLPYGNINGSLSTVNNEAAVVPHNNPNYNAKNATLAQQHYATGQPLYRRSAVSSNVLPSVHTSQQIQPAYDERVSHSNQAFHFNNEHQHHGHQNQPKLTPEEINLISRALEHQASSGEPFSGDLQNLRVKFMQALSSGEITTAARLPQHQPIQPPPTNFPGHAVDHHISQNYHQGLTASVNNPALPQNNVFTPIPHKSPAGHIPPPDRSVYNNTYPDSSSQAPMQNRIWQNPNASFPALTEGTNMQAHGMHSHQTHLSNDRGHSYIDPNSRSLYNHQPSNAPMCVMPQQQVIPRPLCGPNNNTLPYPNNEYIYHNDGVGGGLKAQLSGGLRQGFGERSAFSRVHDSQDMDIMPDSSGLGRSYANVVKAAVTTAAVGTGVPSSSMSMAPNVSRPPVVQPPSAPVPSHMYPNPNMPSGKFYGTAGAPMHHHYSGSGP